MNKKAFLYSSALFFLSTLAVVLFYSTDASAQRMLPDARAVTQCYDIKLKATGKYVNCLLRAERRANRNMVETSPDDVAHCHENFEQRFMRAEAKAQEQGVECPSHGGLVPYQQNIIGATSFINLNNEVKTLNIQIDQQDLASLMNGSFNLNIAIKVNDEFNVVWRSVSDYLSSNQFQWSPVFHVFGASSTELGAIVDIGTNVVDIALGQDVVFGEDKLLGTPVIGNSKTGITFFNNAANAIFPALAQQLTELGSTQAITSIYIHDEPILNGESVLLTPSQEVMVWFGQGLETGTTFKEELVVSNFFLLDLTNESSATLSYSNGQWSMTEEN